MLVSMLVASLVSSGFALPSTAPAFFWSPRYEYVNFRYPKLHFFYLQYSMSVPVTKRD